MENLVYRFQKLAGIITELYQEKKDSTFTHDNIEYSLNKLERLVDKSKPIDIEVSKLKWILKYTKIFKFRVEKANIKYPILITKYGKRWVVLDGAHRLQKAINENIKLLPAIKVTQEILSKAKLKD